MSLSQCTAPTDRLNPAPCLSLSSWELGGRRPLTFTSSRCSTRPQNVTRTHLWERCSEVVSVVWSSPRPRCLLHVDRVREHQCEASGVMFLVLSPAQQWPHVPRNRHYSVHCVRFSPRASTSPPPPSSCQASVRALYSTYVESLSSPHERMFIVRAETSFSRMRSCSSSTSEPSGGGHRSAALSWSPNSLHHSSHSLFTLTQSWWWELRAPPPPPPPPPPTHPPPHYLLYLMGPLLFPPPFSLSTFIYIFIHSTPALRVTVFNIIGETWLLPLNAEITGAFFLSSSPLHFSRVAPRGRNIFISPCAPSFKTFTPAVWKIFLIFLPHGVEKSP